MSKHKAITKEEIKLDNDNRSQESKFYLEMSAQPIRPAGTKYLGTLCTHVYVSELTSGNELVFAAHTDTEIPEALADEALKDLRVKAMTSYGRKQHRSL